MSLGILIKNSPNQTARLSRFNIGIKSGVKTNFYVCRQSSSSNQEWIAGTKQRGLTLVCTTIYCEAQVSGIIGEN